MSGQNRLITSAMQKASESAITKALSNANEVAAKNPSVKKGKKK